MASRKDKRFSARRFHGTIRAKLRRTCIDNYSLFLESLAACVFFRLWHRRAMESHELLRDVFEKKSAKEVSQALQLSTSMVYKWAQPAANEGGIGNPLDRIEALYESTGDERIVQWICQRAGGFFIHNPVQKPAPHYLIPATNRIVQEFADLLQVVAVTAGDNRITLDEAKKIRQRWEDLKSVTEGFVAGCEHGNFDSLREIISPKQKTPTA